MARNISTILFYDNIGVNSSFIVPAASFVNLDINLSDITNYQGLIEVTYAATSGTTGLTCFVFYGFGPSDTVKQVGPTIPVVLEPANTNAGPTNVYWSDCGYSSLTTGDPIGLVAMAPSTGTSQTKRTPFYGSDPIDVNPRWMKLQFTNTDTAHAASVRIFIDA
jgi:hypothetical protein